MFEIDSSTGEISVAQTLDRETEDEYTLIVTATDNDEDSPLETNVTVTIEVLDVNDNTPTFPSTPTTFTISETLRVGRHVATISATDGDEVGTDNSDVFFNITGGSGAEYFDIDPSSGSLTLALSLDYETNTSFELVIEVNDRGSPSLGSNKTFTIRVRNEDDNAPDFSQETYTFSIDENNQINDVIGQIEATDLDPHNRTIGYSFAVPQTLFMLNRTTGNISASRVFDLESMSNGGTYEVEVEAFYQDDINDIQDTAMVIITIGDEDEFDIVVEDVENIEIYETENVSDVVRVVDASDRDADSSLRYSLSVTNDILEIDSTTGEIYVAKEIDRESSILGDSCPTGTPNDVSCARFNIRITDITSGDQKRDSLYLLVRDLDDEPPEFSEATYYYANLSENTDVGFELTSLELSATDPDIGVSLAYAIPSDQGIEDFVIGRLVARIDVEALLDYERNSTYNFTITATDTGDNVGSATVVIDIFDENDNTPEFTKAIFTQTIPEDSEPGLEVSTVNATDRDSTSNAELTYTITDGNVGSKFEIDSETGLVTLEASIDRENVSFYSLTIQAVDGGEDSLTGSVLLNISISDIDDHPPYFVRSEFVGEVVETADTGDDVLDASGNPLQLTVVDPDVGADVTIISYEFGAPFDVDETTGNVTVSSELDAEMEHEYEFLVIARDNTNLLSLPATVTITVVGANEHRPVFEEDSYELTLEENSREGEVVLEVVAEDEDRDDTVTYSLQTSFNGSEVEQPELASGDISSGDEMEEVTFPFEIDNSTGEITLLRNLDYETASQWVFNVTATDKQNENSVVSVTIDVEDLNDNPPRFVNHTFEIFIRENATVSDSEPVSDLIQARDSDSVSEGNLRYYIVSGAEGTFEMDRETGELLLILPLDPTETPNYELEVVVSDGENEDTAVAEITVVDVNNHSPVFTEDTFTFSLSENSTNGTFVGQVEATDDDFDEFGSITYAIIGGDSEIFLIDNSTGEIYTIASTFDADSSPYSYQLTVEASDGGSPSLTTNTSVEITLEDVNDNDPEFTVDPFEFEVAEDVDVDESVFRVTASDSDSGSNAEMDYEILTENSSFSIDSDTGIVRVARELDYDNTSLPNPVVIEILVTDRGTPPRSSNGTLNITITDVNDNAPYFTGDLIQAFVAENTSVNHTAFTVMAFDRDSNENAELSYEILNTIPEECETRYRIVSETGEVILNEPVDAEEREESCSLLVRATDNGVPRLSNTATFNVLITDINEQPPEFIPAQPTGEVAENSRNGTSVLTLETTDGDGDTVRYRAIGGSTAIFDITSSGLITVARGAMLDREMRDTYELLVEARDDGTPRKSTETTVTVTITDENDNVPVFSERDYYISVRENLGLNEAFGTIVASDQDIGTNDDIEYRLVENVDGDTDFGKFAVKSDSGQLFLMEGLDFETEDHYYLLRVQADDGVFQTNTSVHIRVLESNDITPTFENLPSSVDLTEDSQNGTLVFNVSATDNDLNVNGMITYSLMETEGSEKFSIDPDTGVIVISGDNQFDFDEGEQTYELTVVAMDNAGAMPSGDNEAASGSAFGNDTLLHPDDEVRTNTSTLTIQITDVNDNAPLFTEDSYNPVVVEHDGISLTVITVTATDADKPNSPNSQVNYNILSGAFGRFEIQPNGDIVSVPPIDREVVVVYNLLVIAYDDGDPSLNTTINVTVTVHDSDDERPVFTQTRYTSSVMENTPSGVSVLEVRAVDRDTIESPANYSLQDSEVSDFFTINTTTGLITTSDLVIDHEANQNFILVAQAGDISSIFSTAKVFVTVIDENDERPVFQKLEYSFNVSENQQVGTRLRGVRAIDRDSGTNAETIYELELDTGRSGLFDIDSENGDIIVESLPCFSESSTETHTFTLHATDNLNSSLSDTAFLTISLFEQNKYPPVFVQPSYVSRLDSLAAEGTEVLPNLRTTDKDVCSGDPIFEIINGNDNNTFSIDSETGRIVLTRNLTENDLSFTLSVQATDTGNFEVSNLTATVSTIVLVGQPLPVSVTVEPGLKTLLISRRSQFRYVQRIWLHDSGGSPANSAPNITFSLGSVSEQTQIPVVGATAESVAAALARSEVYPDEPEILVGVQVEGPGSGRSSVEPTQVFVRVVTESDSSATTYCTTAEDSGSCVASVPIPSAWFSSGTNNVSVYYGLSEPASTFLGEVRINSVDSCDSSFSAPAVSVKIPAKVIFPGSTFDVSVRPHLDKSINYFRFTFTMAEGIEFVKITWYPSDYNIQYGTDDDKFTVTATYFDNSISSTGRILEVQFRLKSDASVSDTNVLNLNCNVDYLVNADGEEVLSNVYAYHVNFDESGSCSALTGKVLVGSPTLVKLFPYTHTTGLLNTAFLNGEEVRVNIVPHGLLSSGELTNSVADLECESADDSILKVDPSCLYVYLEGNETGGSEAVDITVTHSLSYSTLSLQVWFPTDVDITLGVSELSSVQGVFTSECKNAYERTSVTVQAVFESGDQRQVATVTPLVSDILYSSDTDVILLEADSDSGIVEAVGVGSGDAYVTLQVDSSTVYSETIDVSGLSVVVNDISFSLHTGLSPSPLPQATAGESYLERAEVELLNSPEYLNQPISVLAEAVLSNGRNLKLSDDNGLVLESVNEDIVMVTSWQEISVRGGGTGLFLRGSLDTERCPLTSITVDDVFSTLVEVEFQPISRIDLKIADTTLGTPLHASLLGLPTETTAVAYLVHEDGTSIDITEDSRTSFASSGNQVSINSTGVLTSTNSYGLTNVTVAYTYNGVEYTSLISVEVVSITSIEVSAYPYPSYSGSESVSLTTLRQYPVINETVFQRAQIQVNALLSDGSSTDITDSDSVSFSVSNSSILELNGTTVQGLDLGNVTVTAQLGALEADISFTLTETVLNITDISEFKLNTNSDGFLIASGVGTEVVPSLTLKFSDGTLYPSFLTPSGPALEGLIQFSSSDQDGLPVNTETGVLEISGNRIFSTDQFITAQLVSWPSITSQIAISGVDLEASLGDADIEVIVNYPLTVGETVEVKLYINAEDESLGVVQLKLNYNDSLLTLDQDPMMGQHLPSPSLFESFSGFAEGEINLAFVTPEDTTGSRRMHVATVVFRVKEPHTLDISVDVVLMNAYSATPDTIGDPVPRESNSASLYSNHTTSRTVESDTVRCSQPPCTPSDCEDLGGTTPLGDVNADCVFDSLDVLAVQLYTSRATLDPESFSDLQLEAMDADKNGRIDLQDAEFLLSASLGRYPLIADPILQPIDAEFSDCILSINVTLDDSFGDIFVFFGLFHKTSTFGDEYDVTEFAVGDKLSSGVPDGSFGGWSEPTSYGGGTYGIVTEPGTIAKADISFVVIYGVLALNGSVHTDRLVFLTGPPSLPLSHAAFTSNFEVFGSSVTLSSDGAFNGLILFDNSFTATDCYNLHAPVLDGTGLATVQQRENVDIDTVVLSVSASDADSPLRAGDIQFSLRDITQPGTLEIDPDSGDISISSTLDRESYEDIRATVVATDQGPHVFTRQSDTLELILRVVDVNDNPSVPDQLFYSITVGEDEESVIFQFSGSDADIDSRNRGISDVALSYNGSETENIFRVDTSTDPDEQTFTASLVLVGSLDFESRVFYNLSLEIFDDGDPTQSSELTIELDVTDANDNRPEFTSPETIVILENNEIGVPVIELRAEDADTGTNAEFTFKINSVSEADDDGVGISGSNLIGYFTLQSEEDTSGHATLRANRTYDREGIHSFIVVISAREEGIESDTAVQFLWVMVCEQNDHTPTFPSEVSGSIDENSEEGTIVIRLQATDLDAGPFCDRDTGNAGDNVVEYTLLNSDETPFIIDRVAGNVSVNGSLDYEIEKSYVLEVVAYDLGTPSLSSRKNITISVVDLNDNAPVLSNDSYVTGAFENSTVDTELLVTITATDQDSGENEVIKFNISGEGSTDFAIDPDTGTISVAMSLDRDARQEFYYLTVIAYNPNDPSLNDTASLNITVFDINDNRPTFDQPSYYGEVSENAVIGTPVLTVTAMDADEQSRKITYRLETSYSDLFTIDADSGVVYVTRELCVGENAMYTFVVVAEDRPVNIVTFTNSTNITILVYDDNPNAPVFDRAEYGGIVPDGVSPYHPILTVSATDLDACSPPFKYYVADQPTEGQFRIDEDTGVLYTNATLYKSDDDFYNLSVSAVDTGTQTPLTSFTTVYVVVGETVPVSINVEGGFPTASATGTTADSTYAQRYDYLFNTYIGNPHTFSASYRKFLSSQRFQTDPLPATKVLATVLTPTVYHDSRMIHAAVQALDVFNSYTLGDTSVYMSALYDNSTVSTTGVTTVNRGSTTILSLVLPENWFTSENNSEITVEFGIADELPYTTDTVTLIPSPNYTNLCENYTTKPQLHVRLPSYTLYRGEVFAVPLYAELDYLGGVTLTALSLRCELDAGLRFLSGPFADDSTRFISSYRFENLTSRDALVFTETRVEHPNFFYGMEHIGSLLVEVTESSVEQVSMTCTKYEALAHNRVSDPFSDLLVIDRWGCHDNNRGEVTISKDKLAAIFPSTQQTVIFNDVVFTGARRDFDVLLYAYVLSAIPYPIIIQQQVDILCTTNHTEALQAECSGGRYEVYIDGSETEGGQSVEITFLANSVADGFEGFELNPSIFPASTTVQVWYPDLPIDLTVDDEVLNSVDGWQKLGVNDTCIQGYQTANLEAYATFRTQTNSTSSVLVRVEHLLTVESNNGTTVALSGLEVVGREVGVANIRALSHDGEEIGRVDLSVVDDEVRAVEVEVFHGNNVETVLPNPIPYVGSDPFQVRLDPGLRYETETAELVSSVLFSDGTRYWVSDLVEYSIPVNSSILDLEGSRLTASESGTEQLQVDWSSCNGSQVISRPIPLPLALLTPEVIISLENSEISLSSDPAAVLDAFPTVAYLTVSLVYNINGESVSLDITEHHLTQLSFSPENSVSVVLRNGRYEVEPRQSNTGVAIQASYKSYSSAVETLSIVEALEVTLTARHYPLYLNAPEIDTLRLIGNTGSFQMAKLEASLHVSIPGQGLQVFDISTHAETSYTIGVGNFVTIRDAVFAPRSVGVRQVVAQFSGLSSNHITLNVVTHEEVTVTSIDRLELTSGDTLSGQPNTVAAQLSVGLTFSDGSKLEQAYIDGAQVIPALFTVVFADSDVARITVLTGDVTLLGNAPDGTSLTITVNDRFGLQKTLDFYSNIEPGVHELDLGSATQSPAPAVSPGENFTVPVFINAGSTNVGAIEVGVAYSSSLLGLDSVTAGSDWPEDSLTYFDFFGSSENEFEGFVHFGGILVVARSQLVHIADLHFTAREEAGLANIKAELITYMDSSVPPSPIPRPESSPAANIHVVVGTPTDSSKPDLSVPLENLNSDTTACTGPLPCECEEGREMGDVNGDCVFNLLDVISFYHDDSLYFSPHHSQSWKENLESLNCLSEPDTDFNIDGVCTTSDVNFLLQASFWQAHFVPRLTIVPVNRNDCYLTIEADLVSRGDRPADGDRTSLLIGLYDRDPAADSQYDDTTGFLELGSKVSTTPTSDGDIPASLNGGIFLASASDVTDGRFEVQLETDLVSTELALMLIQVHTGYENQPSEAGVVHMRGYVEFPPVFPEAVRATIHHPWTDILLEWAVASPLLTINQTVASSVCINDNRPRFYPPVTEVSVFENATTGTLVATVFANDSDSERNTVISYSITRIIPNNAEFYINESSGEVYLNSSLDREVYSRYVISIRAEDQGNFGSLRGDGQLIVNVLDINDNDPVFGQAVYTALPILESAPVKSLVIVVFATDEDEDDTIQYSLKNPEKFAINSTTGEIRLASELDYEDVTSYELLVVATDQGGRNGNATVVIEVEPVNDNLPVCPIPSRAIVLEDATVGSSFHTIAVSDADVGSTHRDLTFELIQSGTEFTLNKTGETTADILTTTNTLTFDGGSTYSLSIVARDIDGNECTVSVEVVVGEGSSFNFDITGAGFAIGSPTKLGDSGAFEQRIAMFGNSLPEGTVAVSLGGVTQNASYFRNSPPVSSLNGVLITPQLTYDSPNIRVAAQAKDSTFNTIAGVQVYIRAQLANELIVETTGEVCETETQSGSCIASLEVPQSWFTDSAATVQVLLVSEDVEQKMQNTTLYPRPSFSFSDLQNLIVQFPSHDLSQQQTFNVRIGAPFGNSIIGFELMLDLGTEFVSNRTSTGPWECFTGVTGTTLTCLRGSSQESLPANPIFPEEIFLELELEHTVPVSSPTNYSIAVTVKSVVSRFGPEISSDSPATVIDQRGVSTSPALLTVIPETVLGYLPFAERGEFILVHSDYPTPQLEAVRVTQASTTTINLAQATFDCQYNSQVANCDNLLSRLSVLTTEGSEETSVEFTDPNNSLVFSLPLRVWYPAQIWYDVSDYHVNKVGGLEAGCGELYQQTRIRVWGEYTTGVRTSPPLDVTRFDVPTDYNETVIRVDGGKVYGLSPGNATITVTATPSASYAGQPVEVTEDEIYPLASFPTVFTSLDVAVSQETFDRTSSVTATASTEQSFDAAGIEGWVTTMVYFTDGSRYDPAPSEVDASTFDDAVVLKTAEGTLNAVGSGETTVSVDWVPPGCASSQISAPSDVVVQLPYPVELIVTSPIRILGNSRDVPVTTVQSTATFDLSLTYSDGTLVPVTDLENVRFTAPPSLNVIYESSSISVSANDTSVGGTTTVNFWYGSLTTSGEVTTLHVDRIQTHLLPYPNEALLTEGLSHIDLRQVGSTSYWQQAELFVQAVFSDGSVERVSNPSVSNTGIDGGSHVRLVMENRIIQNVPGSFGTNRITAISGQLSSNNVTVAHLDQVVGVDRIELTISLTDPTQYNFLASAYFVDGTIIGDVTTFSLDVIMEDLVSFTLSPEDVGSINTITDAITISRSHYDLVTLTAAIGEVSNTVSFPANLEPTELAQIDLGAPEGVPIPPVSVGETFSFDVRVNTLGAAVEAQDLVLTYNESALELVSVVSQVGFSNIRYNEPVGEIQLTTIGTGELAPSVDVPTIATVTFTTLAEGLVNIGAYQNILLTTSFSLIAEESTSATVRVGASPSVLYTHSDHTRRSLSLSGNQDTTDDGVVNILDAHNAFVQLGAGADVSDTNWDDQFNIRDVVYLTRVATSLVPVLHSLPVLTLPEGSTGCSLRFDQNFVSFADLRVYAIISHPDIATELNVSQINNGQLLSLDEFSSGVFTTQLTDSDTNRFSFQLYTPLDIRDTSIGYSLIVQTLDDKGLSSPERTVQFIGGPISIAVGENEPIPRVTTPVSEGSAPLVVGERGGFNPLYPFTVSGLRSDYCSFDGSSIALTVPENVTVGSSIGTVSAVRSDLGFPSRDEVYTIFSQTGPGVFTITPEGSLSISTNLDYEQDRTYTLVIRGETAYGDGSFAEYAATVEISIADVNDVAPTLTFTLFTDELLENVTRGYIVAEFEASDVEAGVNGEVYFELYSTSDPLNQFKLEQTAEGMATLTVNGELDRESMPFYNLTVLAIDRGDPPLSSTAAIPISVLDVNDNDPEFSQSSYTISVPEETVEWNYTIQVTDADTGLNGEVSLSLVAAPTEFEIVGDVLILMTALDRELVDTYTFTITATDGGTDPQRMSSADIVIVVTDMNDNAPVLSLVNTPLPILVEEDSVDGTFIAEFTAMDMDIGSNAEFSFRILDPDVPFSIQPVTGVVTLQGTLDVDTEPQYTIFVVVEDGGTPVLNDTFSLTIFVIEGQVVSFDAGQEAFLVGTYVKQSEDHYVQSVGFLTGQDIGTPVRVRGDVNVETLAQDVVEIPNFGGTPSYVQGALLQTEVTHSQKIITAFVQAFDSRGVIAAPTPIRVKIQSNTSAAPLEGSCTTSPDLGYCIVSLSVPDSWFEKPARITAAYANFLSLEEDGVKIGEANIISSLLLTNNFNVKRLLLVPPAHAVFPARSFTAEVYGISPSLYEAYNRVDFDVETTGGTFVSVSSDSTWNCSKFKFFKG